MPLLLQQYIFLQCRTIGTTTNSIKNNPTITQIIVRSNTETLFFACSITFCNSLLWKPGRHRRKTKSAKAPAADRQSRPLPIFRYVRFILYLIKSLLLYLVYKAFIYYLILVHIHLLQYKHRAANNNCSFQIHLFNFFHSFLFFSKKNHRLRLVIEVGDFQCAMIALFSLAHVNHSRAYAAQPRYLKFKYKEIKEKIKEIYNINQGRYGYHRTMELHNQNIYHKTVQRLMKELRRFCRVRMKEYNSCRGEVGKVAPNLVNSDFLATRPNMGYGCHRISIVR